MAKSNSIVSTQVGADSITFEVRGAGSFTFELGKVHRAMVDRAALHGFVQRISDGAALSRNPETGQPASPQDKYNAMRRIADHYMTGVDQWGLRVAGEGSNTGGGGLTIAAMVRAGVAKSPEDAERLVALTMDKKALDRAAALRFWAKAQEVAEAADAIRAERATPSKVSAADLLEGLLGDSEEAPF